jgi:Delta24-sterol reductase
MDTKFTSKETHFQEIEKLRQALGQKNQKFSLKKVATSNTLRSGAYKKAHAQLDLTAFNGILDFNPPEKWIVVESRLTFANLCRFTLSYNLIPPVVPEFTSITVGGAVMGAALESSSHRFGQVNDTCVEYELILGNGEVVTASAAENADLFYACAGSYGTFAILTAVKMRLTPSKRWVHLTYHPFDAAKGAVRMLTLAHQHDFIEGIVFSQSHAVVITGNMADELKTGQVFRQNRPWSPWYVQHIAQTKGGEGCMRIEEYLFRLDKGAFWIGRYIHSCVTMARLVFRLGIPKIKMHGFDPNFFFRLLFGWAFSSEKLYQLWHRVPNHICENLFFIHDFYSPFSQAEKVLESFMEQTGIFPIWLCPIKGTHTPQFLSPHFGGSNFLNIGLYGIPQSTLAIPQLSAQLEKKILDYGGRKMLYSFTYYDQKTFAKIYSESRYNELRKKFSAEQAFPSLYNKVTNNSRF